MFNFRNTKLNINLSDKKTKENLFWKNYSLELHKDFIEKREDKKHITSYIKWKESKKSVDEFDIKILKNRDNNLKNDSLIKIRQIKMYF